MAGGRGDVGEGEVGVEDEEVGLVEDRVAGEFGAVDREEVGGVGVEAGVFVDGGGGGGGREASWGGGVSLGGCGGGGRGGEGRGGILTGWMGSCRRSRRGRRLRLRLLHRSRQVQ